MEEGIYLASFALCALSWGLSPFLMTCGWNTEIADLSLVLPPSTSSNYRVATLLLQLSLPFCLMPHYSTVLSLSKHIDRTSALIPLSDLQITPTPGYHFLCYFYRFVFFWLPDKLSRGVQVQCFLCVASLSANLVTMQQMHAWGHTCLTIFIGALEADPGNWLPVLYTSLSFLSLASC